MHAKGLVVERELTEAEVLRYEGDRAFHMQRSPPPPLTSLGTHPPCCRCCRSTVEQWVPTNPPPFGMGPRFKGLNAEVHFYRRVCRR